MDMDNDNNDDIMSRINRKRNRNIQNDSEYLIGLEPKVIKLLELVRNYKDVCEYSEATKRYQTTLEERNKLEEKAKELKYLQESIRRFRTKKEEPPIDLGDGRVLWWITDPTDWD
jgi:hypothetical protein